MFFTGFVPRVLASGLVREAQVTLSLTMILEPNKDHRWVGDSEQLSSWQVAG